MEEGFESKLGQEITGTTEVSNRFIDRALSVVFPRFTENPMQWMANGNALAGVIFAIAGKPELAQRAFTSAAISEGVSVLINTYKLLRDR